MKNKEQERNAQRKKGVIKKGSTKSPYLVVVRTGH